MSRRAEPWSPARHKTVYILGAGTSVRCGAPIISNFREAARRVLESGSVWWGEAAVAQRNRQVFEQILVLWLKRFPSYNVEEFYVLADLQERLGQLPPLEMGNPPSLADGVRYVICKTLDVSMGYGPSELHDKFVEYTWGHAANRGENVAVITLNWDIALDNAVDRFFGRPTLDCGYPRFEPFHGGLTPSTRRYRVYKLHGSMNWWYCPYCKTLWYDPERKTLLRQWEEVAARTCPAQGCKDCNLEPDGHELTPAMVPPMSQKMERNDLSGVLKTSWHNASDALKDCDWLVIAGYSFPPTDVQFRMFVADAMASNEHLRGLTVVTNRKVGAARSSFEESYAQLVGSLSPDIEVNFLYQGFERWVERGCSGR